MKRIILMIALSIGASMAIAGGNPATYDSGSGRLDIPAVIVDGGPINYSVAFENVSPTLANIFMFHLLPESVTLAEDPSAPEWLFVHTAATAELFLFHHIIIVVPFQQDVFAFTDRPYRRHAYLNATQFVSLWNDAGSDSFIADPPNAVLTWADSGVVKEAEVELLDAILIGDGKSIQYTTTWLTSRYDIPSGTALKNVSFFIDDFYCTPYFCLDAPIKPTSDAIDEE